MTKLRVSEYAKKHNTSLQNVYRWIRENKISQDKIERREVTKIVMFIDD